MQNTNYNATTLITIKQLCDLLGLAQENGLSSSLKENLSVAINDSGYLIVPDVMERNVPPDYFMTLVPIEGAARTSSRYAIMHLLIELGMAMVLQNGTARKTAVYQLSYMMEKNFDFSSLDISALTALKEYATIFPPDVEYASTHLADLVTEYEGRHYAKMLVTVAAAAGKIGQDKLHALKFLFETFGMTEQELYMTITKLEAEEGYLGNIGIIKLPTAEFEEEEPEPTLFDDEEIASKMAEGEALSDFFSDIFYEDEEEDETDAADAEEEQRRSDSAKEQAQQFEDLPFDENDLAHLNPKYYPILRELLTKESWTLAEIKSMARTHGAMHNAMLEEINTWSEDIFGDYLILSDDNRLFEINGNMFEELEETD